MQCADCGGSGFADFETGELCSTCQGLGYIEEAHEGGDAPPRIEEPHP